MKGVKNMMFSKKMGIILTVIMIINIANIAFAEISPGGFVDSKESKQAQAIAYLKAIDLLKGDGGTGLFRPNDFLSRQEFAVIIARLGDPIPGIDITPLPKPKTNISPPETPYVDNEAIADWAKEYVNIVTENGWVRGYEDKTFRPTNNLTYAEALTVLIQFLGHGKSINEIVWPTTFTTKAVELGLNLGVESGANEYISRADMARLTYNALFIPGLIKKDGELISDEPIIKDLSQDEEEDADLKGGTLTFYIGGTDVDGDGYGDVITYKEVLSSSGDPIELWKYINAIKDLINDTSDADSSKRIADLKKLADELRNLLDLDSIIIDNEMKDSDLRDSAIRDPISDRETARLIADLKKLADELVNIYKLAPDVVLIGADNSDELIGKQVKATFNLDSQIYIIELLED